MILKLKSVLLDLRLKLGNILRIVATNPLLQIDEAREFVEDVRSLLTWVNTTAPVSGGDERSIFEFAEKMSEKMAMKAGEGRYGWSDPEVCSDEELTVMFLEHLPKGDPVDIANYCMMLHHRGIKPDMIRGMFKRMYPHTNRG